MREGLLSLDPDPALYVYHQEFEFGGQKRIRRGFMARVRSAAVWRREHLSARGNACGRQSRPAQADHGLPRESEPDLRPVSGPETTRRSSCWKTAIRGCIPLEATDHLGVVHRLWPVTDVKTIAEVAAVMGPRPIFVADGHHRYETACNYRDHVAKSRKLAADDPVNFVLMMCVSMSDPGMIVLPTHRLFRGLPPIRSQQLIDKLADCFSTELAGRGRPLPRPSGPRSNWRRIRACSACTRPTTSSGSSPASPTAAEQRMAEISAEHSADWQGLGVAILHRLVIDTLLGAADLPKPKYVHLVDEVAEALARRRRRRQPHPAGRAGDAGHRRSTFSRSASTPSGCRPRARTSTRSCSADWSLTRWTDCFAHAVGSAVSSDAVAAPTRSSRIVSRETLHFD